MWIKRLCSNGTPGKIWGSSKTYKPTVAFEGSWGQDHEPPCWATSCWSRKTICYQISSNQWRWKTNTIKTPKDLHMAASCSYNCQALEVIWIEKQCNKHIWFSKNVNSNRMWSQRVLKGVQNEGYLAQPKVPKGNAIKQGRSALNQGEALPIMSCTIPKRLTESLIGKRRWCWSNLILRAKSENHKPVNGETLSVGSSCSKTD